MEELLEQIQMVAAQRKSLVILKEQKTKLLQEWEAANHELLESISILGEALSETENELCDMTIKAYQETGSKQPAPGVGVREVTRLEYDPKEALKWALHHEIALSLDKKSFETFAKATPLEFVQIKSDVQATIASDLDAVLNKGVRQTKW